MLVERHKNSLGKELRRSSITSGETTSGLKRFSLDISSHTDNNPSLGKGKRMTMQNISMVNSIFNREGNEMRS